MNFVTVLLILIIQLAGFVASATNENNNTAQLVETSSGVVIGNKLDTKWGQVITFYGIPYAKQPQRFAHSTPILFRPATAEIVPPQPNVTPTPTPVNGSANETANNSSNASTSPTRPLSPHFNHHHFIPPIKVVLQDDGNKTKTPTFYGTPINANYSKGIQPCPQPAHLIDFKHPAVPSSDGSLNEDCLRLNVFVPGEKRNSTSNKQPAYPICVWIPGDGFSFADAGHYDGSALAGLGKIIVIVVNYRVGAFGFASTGDAHIPGNAGLSDVISALEWVRENGEEFGGDISNVTLGGRFSGSMLISLLMTSPKFQRTKDSLSPTLAKRIILHGGIATSPWVIDTNPIDAALKLIDLTNCSDQTTNSSEHIESINCLRDLPVQTLLDASMKVPRLFRPIIDNYIVTMNPMDALDQGLVPENVEFFIGDNTAAGSICYQTHVYSKHNLLDKIKGNFITVEELQDLVQEDLKTFSDVDDEGLASIIAHEYRFPEGQGSNRDIYMKICGLLFLQAPTEITTRQLSRYGRNTTVFRYELDGNYENENETILSGVPTWLETAIGKEIIFLFPTEQYSMTSNEEQIFFDMTYAFSNFITYGVPGQSWEPYSEYNKTAKIFTPNGLKGTTIFYFDKEANFWGGVNKILHTYRQRGTSNTVKQARSSTAASDPKFEVPTTHGTTGNASIVCFEEIRHHEDASAKANSYTVTTFALVVIAVTGVAAFFLVKYGRIYIRAHEIEFCC